MSRIGMPMGGQGSGRRSRCLGSQLTTYADRAMDAESLRHWDRHVVVCMWCRAAVDSERRVLASLRSPSASSLPGDLRGLLLALAVAPADQAPETGPRRNARGLPTVPIAPVRVLDQGAPALHRSARRATMFAGLAAGATAAAAWSLALTGGPVTPASLPVSPGAVQRTRTPVPGFAPAVFTVANLGGSRAVAPAPSPSASPSAQPSAATSPSVQRPGLGNSPRRSAESTP
jgi:hypothetical protein